MATKVYTSLTKVFLESRGLRKCHECVILTWWRRVSCPKCRSPRSRESILVSAVRIVKVLLSKMKKVWMLKSLMESLLYEPILPTIYIWSMREDLSESRQDKSCEDVSSKLGGRETQAEVGHCHNRPEETHRNLMKLIIIDHNQDQAHSYLPELWVKEVSDTKLGNLVLLLLLGLEHMVGQVHWFPIHPRGSKESKTWCQLCKRLAWQIISQPWSGLVSKEFHIWMWSSRRALRNGPFSAWWLI